MTGSVSVLVRVGSMVGQLLEEIHLGDLDTGGHARLGVVLAQAVAEVRAAVDADLARELDMFAPTVDPREPVSEPELRVRHAQLVGWIAGILGTADPDVTELPSLP